MVRPSLRSLAASFNFSAPSLIEESTGSAVGNESLEAEGKGDQASSSIKEGAEKLKDAAKDLKDGLTK